MGKKFQCFFVLGCVIFFSACTSLKLTPSGFLNDYSRMTKQGSRILVEESTTKSLGDYSSFIVDPVVVYLQPDVHQEFVNKEKLNEFKDELYKELVSSLKEKYQVTDTPGPGVLRVRTAITDFVPSTVLLNLHVTSAMVLQPGVGGAAIEAELVDSQTGERVLAVLQSKKGRRSQVLKGFSKWGHAEDVLKHWTHWLVEKIDAAHMPKE